MGPVAVRHGLGEERVLRACQPVGEGLPGIVLGGDRERIGFERLHRGSLAGALVGHVACRFDEQDLLLILPLVLLAGHGDVLLAGLHKLQHRHLRGRILHRDPVRTKRQHRSAALPRLRLEAIGMSDQNFLGQGQATAELLARLLQNGGHSRIEFLNQFQ